MNAQSQIFHESQIFFFLCVNSVWCVTGKSFDPLLLLNYHKRLRKISEALSCTWKIGELVRVSACVCLLIAMAVGWGRDGGGE